MGLGERPGAVTLHRRLGSPLQASETKSTQIPSKPFKLYSQWASARCHHLWLPGRVAWRGLLRILLNMDLATASCPSSSISVTDVEKHRGRLGVDDAHAQARRSPAGCLSKRAVVGKRLGVRFHARLGLPEYYPGESYRLVFCPRTSIL